MDTGSKTSLFNFLSPYFFNLSMYLSEILAEAKYLSVDPYMRAYMIGYKLPVDMIGEQVAK